MNTEKKFEKLEYSEKLLIYQGLLEIVKNNKGYGFHNCDQGHPVYAAGRSGDREIENFGDSSSENELFKMMKELSLELNVASLDNSLEVDELVFTWADFCDIAYTAYEKAKHG